MRIMDQEILKIPSTTWKTESAVLWELVSILPPKLVMVDIGTGAGRTAAVLADASKESTIYTVDDYSGCVLYARHLGEYGLEVAKGNLQRLGLTNVEFLVGKSSEVVTSFNLAIDFLFLDGGHSYKTVCKDIETWGSKVKNGGIIAGHDFDPNCSDGRNVIKAIFDKLLIDPNENLHVKERIWWTEK
jgi:predicted O-methyltransferase YrrM